LWRGEERGYNENNSAEGRQPDWDRAHEEGGKKYSFSGL